MNPIVPAGALLVGCWWYLWRKLPLSIDLQRRSQGQLMEILLYADLPGLMFKVLADLLRTSFRLLLALSPLSLLALACTLLMLSGLRGFCQWRPPVAGEALLVSAPGRVSAALQVGPGLRLDSAPLQTASATYWRVVAQKEGSQPLWLEPGKRAWLRVGPAWAYLRPQQGELRLHYPPRQFWWRDQLVQWPLALALCCLGWLVLGAIFNCCWWILVRQDAKSTSRNYPPWRNRRVYSLE